MYLNCLPLENISSSETPTQNENRSPAKRNLTTESIIVKKTRTMAELVEIKKEPDIKLEPESEVDTIEYEHRLNQLDDKCIPKVEKIEPNDNGADDVRTASHRSGHSDLFNVSARNRNARIGIGPIDNEQPCSSQMGNNMKQPRGRSAVDGMKALNAGKSKEKPTKMIKKTNNRGSSQKKQHKCKDCGYVATRPSHLKRHMLKHSGAKPFPCPSCDKRFSRKSDLHRHLRTHVNKDLAHCQSCLQKFATKEEKLIHDSMCKRRRYECFLCQAYSTPLITNLKRHMRIHSGVRPFQCVECLMKFTRKDYLKKHLKTHTRPQKPRCSVCARKFLTESEKVAHEIKCNKPRYDCYLCKSYMSNSKHCLQLHMRMKHTGARPFKCDSCEKGFAAKGRLKCHIERIHYKH